MMFVCVLVTVANIVSLQPTLLNFLKRSLFTQMMLFVIESAKSRKFPVWGRGKGGGLCTYYTCPGGDNMNF